MNIRRFFIVIAAASAIAVAGPAASAHPTTADFHRSPDAKHFQNCTAMHKVYPHGVGKPGARDHVSGSSKPVTNFKVSTALYNANSGLDRDHDKIACEAH